MEQTNTTPISGTVLQPTTIAKILEPVGLIKEAIEKPTKDMYLAAAFRCEGCRYERIDKTDKTRMVFVFEGGQLADRVERDWNAQNLVVSATTYAESLRWCKTLIHA